MPVIRNVTSGPSASASIEVLLASGSPARRAPKLLRSWSAVISKPEASTNRSRNVLPTSRCSRSASTKLAVASLARFGLAGRPDTIDQRSVVEPSCSSSGMIGRRSTGPTRRPVPVVPVNSRLTLARASSAHLRERGDVVERRRRHRAFPPAGRRGCSRPRARRRRSSPGRIPDTPWPVRAAPASSPNTTPPPRPATRAMPSQDTQRLRSSARRRASTAATRAPSPLDLFAGTRLRRRPFRVGGARQS